GNDFKVKWFARSSNLHRVWDSEMIDHYKMSYSELALNRKKITKDEVKKNQSGTLLDWTNESHTLAIKIYDSAEKGDNLMWNYMYDWFSVVREQIQKGGIRLAKILNDIYG
ncbi:MAG TPA: S1/P1 nuclease, partial [Flavobacteriaceae bacterium]|nr:S1/P1 nuclease [Flavobacteriaceae bacterium]